MSLVLPVVVFSHGAQLFGVEAVRVAGLGRINDQSPVNVPFSALYTRQNDMESAIHEPVTQWLRLRGATSDWLLGLSHDAELIELDSSEIHPLPELLSQSSSFNPLKALAFYQRQLIALLDVDLLTQLAKRRCE